MRSIRNQAPSMQEDGHHLMGRSYAAQPRQRLQWDSFSTAMQLARPGPANMQCCKALTFHCTYGKTAAGFAWAVPGKKWELWSWVPIGLLVYFAHQQDLLFSADASWNLLSLEKALSCLTGITVFVCFFFLSSNCFSNGFLF